MSDDRAVVVAVVCVGRLFGVGVAGEGHGPMTLSDTLARAMCCANGCTTPDACRAGDLAQLIAIPQAAAIAAREMPRLLCDRWRQFQTMATENR